MLKFNPEKENCTGCTACMSVCPKKCIEMERDEEGFLYPVATNECINCGKCERICPVINANRPKNTHNKKAFAALALDKEIWRNSASGGAFSGICYSWGDSSTLVCGASWNGIKVEHKCVIGIDNIAIFRKSKYVESNLCNCFERIKDYLDKEEGKCIFVGTPCQVAGLRSFLGKEHEKLLLIDLICHGVGSQTVFNKCVESIGQQFNGTVKSYQFRAKRDKYESDHIQKVEVDDRCIYIRNDQYIQLFLNQNCLRPSCGGNCRFRNENRQGDITIADFKGLSNVFPSLMGTEYNYSSIIINSEKGYKVLANLQKQMQLIECTIDNIKAYNPLFYRQTESSKERNAFFADFVNNPDKAINKWTRPAEIAKISLKRKMYNYMPFEMRRFVSKILRRGV